MSIGDLLRVEPGSRPDLDAIDPAGTPGWDGDKAAARDRLKELRAELGDFQERLWAESSQSLLIVLQALDAGGKDGLIRKFTAFNPQGTRVTGFGVPSDEELRHDYLARPCQRARQGAHRRLQPQPLRGRPRRPCERARPGGGLE